MASRNFAPIMGALERGVALIFAKVAYDGTNVQFSGHGIKSVTRTALGRYQVTLDDRYLDLLGAFGSILGPSPQTAYVTLEKANPSDTTVKIAKTDGVIHFQLRNDAGALVDPGANSEVLLVIFLKNSKA